jgi:hypothetical protein
VEIPAKIWAPLLLFCLVVVGVGAFGAYSLVQAHNDIGQLQRQVRDVQAAASHAQSTADNAAGSAAAAGNAANQAQNTASQAQSTATEAQDTATKAENSLGTLSTPSDPLSAYDLICSQDQTNNSTGLTQLYYFPCTNIATTTPQPGA